MNDDKDCYCNFFELTYQLWIRGWSIIILLYIDAEEHLMACFMAVPSVVHVKDNERK